MSCTADIPEDCFRHCEERGGWAAPRPRIRIGTTLGFRDEPLNALLALQLFDGLPTARVEWVQCPTDLDAVSAMLSSGLVDMAMLPSEEAVLQLITRGSIQACGMLSGAPRRWGLVLPVGAAPATRGHLGIPDCLGARLMAAELGELPGGWGVRQAELVEHTILVDALRSLLQFGIIKAVLWELSASERCTLAAAQTVYVARELLMPWPSHVFLASKETLRTKLFTIKHVFRAANLLMKQFRANSGGESLHYLKRQYHLSSQEAARWLKTAAWDFSFEIDEQALLGPLLRLRTLRLVPNVHESVLGRCLAPGLRMLVPLPESITVHRSSEGINEEEDLSEEGPRPPLPAARPHHLLPELPAPALCPYVSRQCRGPWTMKAEPVLLPVSDKPQSCHGPASEPGRAAAADLLHVQRTDHCGRSEPDPAG